MISALAIFGDVIDRLRLDLDLASGIVALKIGRVILGVPKAPFHEREELDAFGVVGDVAYANIPYFAGLAERNEIARGNREAVFLARDLSVSKAMAAFILVEGRAHGLPGWAPGFAGVVDI